MSATDPTQLDLDHARPRVVGTSILPPADPELGALEARAETWEAIRQAAARGAASPHLPEAERQALHDLAASSQHVTRQALEQLQRAPQPLRVATPPQ